MVTGLRTPYLYAISTASFTLDFGVLSIFKYNQGKSNSKNEPLAAPSTTEKTLLFLSLLRRHVMLSQRQEFPAVH